MEHLRGTTGSSLPFTERLPSESALYSVQRDALPFDADKWRGRVSRDFTQAATRGRSGSRFCCPE